MLISTGRQSDIVLDFLTAELDGSDLLGVAGEVGKHLFIGAVVDLDVLVSAASQDEVTAVIDVDGSDARRAGGVHRRDRGSLLKGLDGVDRRVLGRGLSLATTLRQATDMLVSGTRLFPLFHGTYFALV